MDTARVRAPELFDDPEELHPSGDRPVMSAVLTEHYRMLQINQGDKQASM